MDWKMADSIPVDWNNSFVDVNGGNTVAIGEFNASVTGLIPGQRYYFRGSCPKRGWFRLVSGDPEVSNGLLGYWRMDETNGSIVSDSIAPFRNAQLQGNDLNNSRPDGYRAKAIYFDGYSSRVNLDVNNTDFLEESFDGRSVSLWIKPESDFYTGPRVVAYEDLVGYYPFDFQTDSKVDDLSANELKGNLLNGSYLQSGQFGQSVSLTVQMIRSESLRMEKWQH